MAGRLFNAAAAGDSTAAIDLDHLERSTFGNRALAREVLSLFDRQADKLLLEIAEAPDAKTRNHAAHTLKGAARGVGAFGVAQAAEAVENRSGDLVEQLAILSARTMEARLEIRGLLSQD